MFCAFWAPHPLHSLIVNSIHKGKIFEQSLKTFMNTIVALEMPADMQGSYSYGTGTSGYMSSQPEFEQNAQNGWNCRNRCAGTIIRR